MKKRLKSWGIMSHPLKLNFKVILSVSLFFISIFQLQATANDLETKISLHLDEVTVEQALKKIESLTDFKILYNDNDVNYARKVSADFDQVPVSEILNSIFSNTSISYEVLGNQIIFKKNAVEANTSKVSNETAETVEELLQRTVSGTVVDNNGVPLGGVSIILQGTSSGTTTDFDGNYSIQVSANTDVLVFSYIGMTTVQRTVGTSSTIDLQMAEDAESLSEIVVTALGITRDARKLGYSVAKVDPAEMNVNRSANFMNSLQGKVSGVNVQSLGSGPGGSSKVRIRGQSSISGTNSPLIVVNGTPIDNTSFGTNVGSRGNGDGPGTSGGGVFSDGGDGFSSINPDDIESMTILKGATAAALYGSRAKDGVIMITTKKRGDGNGIGVTYNLNVTTQKPLDFTDWQYEYGQGENGVRPTSSFPQSGQWSFGEKIEPGMTHVLYDGLVVPYVAQKDRVNEFYRNGLDITNTISLAGGGDKGGFNLSIANLYSEGIVPNNGFNRTNITLGVTHDFNDKLSMQGNISYSDEKNTNPPNVGQQDNTIPVALSNLANTMPLSVWEDNAFDENGDEIGYSRFRNRTNAYFTLAKQFNNIQRDRVFGNISLNYKFLPWLSGQIRAAQDYWSRDQEYNGYPTGQVSRRSAPDGFVNGEYTQEVRRFRETNIDFLISASKEFGEFGVDALIGGNQMERRTDLNRVNVTDFVIRDLYTQQNARVKDPFYNLQERGVNSLYGSVDLSYQDTYFLTGTVRNDWFSTLSPENRSILYPSVSGSYLFSNHIEADWLTFGKIRAAYAEVGSDTDVQPYAGSLFYGINGNLAGTPAGNFVPVGNSGGTLPNPNLKPMRVNEIEFGLDLRLFDNRIGLDMAYYNKRTYDQILTVQISNASSFTGTLINAGESRTSGFEFLLRGTPVRTADFEWEANVNVSFNDTEVVKLITDEPGDRIEVGGHTFNGDLFQVVGEPIAQLGGFGYDRDSAGNQIFLSSGRPKRTDDIKLFGSALHKAFGGITNNFKYKDFNLSVFVDFKLGGKMISGTNFNATRHGLHKMTLPGREGGVVGVGVNEAGQPNTVAAESQFYWEVIRSRSLIEPIVYNAGFWKLRQITLGYNLRKLLPENSAIKGATLSLVANNVAMLKKWVPNIDPDSFGYLSDNVNGLETTGVPTTGSFGFNLNLKF